MAFNFWMLKKFLKEVFSSISGKPAEDLVDLLDTKKHINEFVIAKKLGLTINQTRNILYKISDHGLVSSIRKKDKRKGWYTYFWKIETLKSLEFLRNDLLKKIENFQNQIKSRETKRFYVCDKCHIELNEENALVNNFTCPECGSVLMLKDNSKMISEMKKNSERLKKDLEFIEHEVKKESEIIGKKRFKEFMKEKKEKERVSKLKRIKKAKEKAKLSKKFPKKKQKKVKKKKKRI